MAASSSSAPLTSKIFVGGISWETTDAAFTSYFSRFGEIKDATIMRDKTTGASRGFGFVRFADASSVDKVLSQELELDGRKIDCKLAVPRESIGEAPGLHRTRKVFVGGLSFKVTQDDLKQHFSQFGTIVNAVVMMDTKSNRSRGFGFVTFDSESTVDAVLARTHVLGGKPVECKKAVPKEKIQSDTRQGIVEQGYGFAPVVGFGGPGFGYGFAYPPAPRFREDFSAYGAYGRGITGTRGFGYDEAAAATGEYWGQTEAALVGATDESGLSAYGTGRGVGLARGLSLGRGRGLTTAYPETGAYGTSASSYGYGAITRNTKATDRAFHPYR